MQHRGGPHSQKFSPGGDVSPVRVFALVIVVVFAVEAGIMLVLARIFPRDTDSALLSVVDSVVLVASLCPVLWILVVRPLRTLVSHRGELLTRLISIQEHERAKMARDLHDELGQVQTAVVLASRSLINAQSLEQARERGELVHQMAAEAMETTRRLARGLSPSVLADFGLGRAIERLCEDFTAAGSIEVSAENGVGHARFKSDLEIAVYRVAQEAITNAARHSGGSRVWVRLTRDGGRLVLEVTDNGRGFDPSSISPPSDGGLGIPGMNERTVLLGGRFEILPASGGGTTVRTDVPATDLPDGLSGSK